jgi:hypothetical protein
MKTILYLCKINVYEGGCYIQVQVTFNHSSYSRGLSLLQIVLMATLVVCGAYPNPLIITDLLKELTDKFLTNIPVIVPPSYKLTTPGKAPQTTSAPVVYNPPIPPVPEKPESPKPSDDPAPEEPEPPKPSDDPAPEEPKPPKPSDPPTTEEPEPPKPSDPPTTEEPKPPKPSDPPTTEEPEPPKPSDPPAEETQA